MNYTYNNGMKNINTNTMSSSEIRSREEHNLKVLNKNFKQKMKWKKSSSFTTRYYRRENKNKRSSRKNWWNCRRKE